jgi:hypothetical protein
MRFICSLCLLGILFSCSKQPEPLLFFKMAGTPFVFTSIEKAVAERNCRLRTYEVTAYSGEHFFKIDFTDADTLRPGLFLMGSSPTNNLQGTATFWYSGKGTSYTAKPFKLFVQSYHNGILKASFGGGAITEGNMCLQIVEK